MGKKLPNVFANAIDKKFNNFQEVYDGRIFANKFITDDIVEHVSIETKINRIFNSPYHVYKSRVEIDTGNEILDKVVIGKTRSALLTQDNELIDIKRIKDIKTI